ncbi:MAG: hypothetical protein K5697_15200 [Lachnospiraceae bacterium]|nr:hypothetical protein [Lachnospiraceae bacterium]
MRKKKTEPVEAQEKQETSVAESKPEQEAASGKEAAAVEPADAKVKKKKRRSVFLHKELEEPEAVEKVTNQLPAAVESVKTSVSEQSAAVETPAVETAAAVGNTEMSGSEQSAEKSEEMSAAVQEPETSAPEQLPEVPVTEQSTETETIEKAAERTAAASENAEVPASEQKTEQAISETAKEAPAAVTETSAPEQSGAAVIRELEKKAEEEPPAAAKEAQLPIVSQKAEEEEPSTGLSLLKESGAQEMQTTPEPSEQQAVESPAAENVIPFQRTEPEISRPAEDPVVVQMMAAPVKKKKKRRVGRFIAMLFLLASIGAGVYVGYLYYTDPTRRALEQLGQGNIETAMYYLDRIGPECVEGQKRFTDAAVRYARQTYNRYQAATLNYSEASWAVKKLHEGILSKNAELGEILEMVDSLEQSRIAYENAGHLKDAGKYEEAALEYGKVIKEDSAYEASQQAILDCRDLCREEVLNRTKIYEDAGMYAEAIAVLDDALQILSDDRLIVERSLCRDRLNEEKGEAVIDEAEEMLGDGKDPVAYKTALEHLDAYLKENPDDAQVKKKRKVYDKAYYKGMIRAAEDAAKDKDYDTAIGVLDSLAKDYPENEEIDGLIGYYTSKKPVRLVDLEVFEQLGRGAGTVYFNESTEDTFQNRYSDAIGVRELYSSELDSFKNYKSIGYIVNSNYDHFHCVLAYEKTANTQGKAIVEFLLDDEVIYTTDPIKKSTGPVSVDLNLKKGQLFTIRFVNNKKEECADIILAEAEFSRMNEADVSAEEILPVEPDEEEDEAGDEDDGEEAFEEEEGPGKKDAEADIEEEDSGKKDADNGKKDENAGKKDADNGKKDADNDKKDADAGKKDAVK